MEKFIQDTLSNYINPNSPQGISILLVLLVWSMVLKAIGLWKSARNNERFWFIAILLLNSVGILEIAYLFFFATEKLTFEQITSNIKSYKFHSPIKRLNK